MKTVVMTWEIVILQIFQETGAYFSTYIQVGGGSIGRILDLVGGCTHIFIISEGTAPVKNHFGHLVGKVDG